MIAGAALDTPITVKSNYQIRGTFERMPLISVIEVIREPSVHDIGGHRTVHVRNIMQMKPRTTLDL